MLRGNVELQDKVIDIIQACGLVAHACSSLGISREALRQLRKNDAAFNERFDDALAVYKDSLEREAHRRAVEGYEEPVYYKGDVVGTVRKYSDRLLELMLKKNIPAFKDRAQTEVNVNAGVLVVQASASSTPEGWIEEHQPAPKEVENTAPTPTEKNDV